MAAPIDIVIINRGRFGRTVVHKATERATFCTGSRSAATGH